MSERFRPIGGRLLTPHFYFLGLLLLIAAWFIAKRFIFGIGAVSNLSDGFPWGIWITYDVVTGTAIACGGYAMALMVYVFNRGQFHPMIRAALLTSVFGYTLAGASIIVDVGRWWQLYNVFLPQYMNLNSVMLEVALCVTLYTVVLWIEFSPTILEAMQAKRWLRNLRHFLFIAIGLGILLPTMHQSSLGSLLIIAGDKVHPLWQTNIIPLLFLLTAITMGYAIVVFESLYASVNLRRPLETPLLSKISAVIPWLLIVYLVLRIGESVISGDILFLFRGGSEPLLFMLEVALFVYVIRNLRDEKQRVRPTVLFWTSLAVLLGGALYRFDAFMIAFDPGPGWHYFPAVGEMMITIGIVAFEIMAYLFFVKMTPVMMVGLGESGSAVGLSGASSGKRPTATASDRLSGQTRGEGGFPPRAVTSA
ncbi:Ni/Fe-hydrogenase cytochrome b subunit [Lamprobacter modestohalophilus]|uniref:Ni/Fe-hydrogenase cytochrome b subunit n=1 Tax=Lamprobacter modestohalophilus TaxID=1064514 RepID=A0A9X0W8U5_9GAMM|nr:Ni/Fe-hydrogenase cytochrome b subunit [Lamprobacter modestohalophilus]MBK1619011.1 Ni/Fe-hydrogenase cytochrome b subunit [Lamprobacter modestohalophilus]